MIFDSFMVNGDPAGPELDMLECRLVELENVPNVVHVAVEADVDHQGNAKPYHVTENLERFAPWKDRLRVVRATGLPTVADDPDPWAREHSQREYASEGMTDASSDDVVLHGDLDEIPNPLVVRNVRPRGMVVFEMVCCSQAVDWLHPDMWPGTVAATVERIESFSHMRDCRNTAERRHRAGFHLGWLGGNEARWRKLHSFCHPEIEPQIAAGLGDDWFYREGYHVHGRGEGEPFTKLLPVDVDRTWPRYVRERRCPDNWFRPREVSLADVH